LVLHSKGGNASARRITALASAPAPGWEVLDGNPVNVMRDFAEADELERDVLEEALSDEAERTGVVKSFIHEARQKLATMRPVVFGSFKPPTQSKRPTNTDGATQREKRGGEAADDVSEELLTYRGDLVRAELAVERFRESGDSGRKGGLTSEAQLRVWQKSPTSLIKEPCFPKRRPTNTDKERKGPTSTQTGTSEHQTLQQASHSARYLAM